MLFHKFDSQEERRDYGGSAFLEMQFCRLLAGTGIGTLVAVDSIVNWLNDSLYISDENLFYEEYSRIFDCGVYNNGRTGPVDVYGINYYGPEQIDLLLARIQETEPEDWQVLTEWLKEARKYNGFYILGI